MPKVTRQHQEARKNQIIDAAIECFSKKGFHQSSMQDIVRESGLSPGAIYLYFKSKEEIIKTTADERHKNEKDTITEAFGSSNPDIALSQLVEIFFNSLLNPNVRKQRNIGIQLWGEALSNPHIYSIVHQSMNDSKNILTEMLKTYLKQENLPQDLSIEYIARVILAQFQGFVLQVVFDENIDVEKYIKAVKQIISISFLNNPFERNV